MSRILLITTTLHPDLARTSIHRARQIVQAARDLGHQIELLDRQLDKPLRSQELTQRMPYLFPQRKLPDRPSLRRFLVKLRMLFKALALASHEPYHLIHATSDAANLAWLVARFTRTPLIIEHTPHRRNRPRRLFPPYNLFEAISRWFRRLALRDAAAVITPDPSIIAKLQSLGRHSRACLMPEITTLLSEVSDPALNLAKARFRSGSCSHLITCALPDSQAEATLLPPIMSQIRDQIPTAHFAIAGANTPFKEHIRSLLSNELDIITHIPTNISEVEYTALIRVSDILLSINTRAPVTPPVLLDALSAKLPIVAIENQATRTILDHRTARLTSDNPSDLANAVVELCRDTNLATSLKNAGQRILRDEGRTSDDLRYALRCCYDYALALPH